jgi:hypothetical protein
MPEASGVLPYCRATSESSLPSGTAEGFARCVIRAICETSVSPRVGRMTYERCLRALAGGSTARLGFRHPGKAEAIDQIWTDRVRLRSEYLASDDKLAFLATLPWVGPVTRRGVAADLGLTNAEVPARRAA